MCDVLERRGYRFTGNNVEDEANEWIDNGFDADSAGGWCEIGCWDAATANILRDAGLTPAVANDAAQRLVDASENAATDYTDGDPIYSACNGDTDVKEIIDMAKHV